MKNKLFLLFIITIFIVINAGDALSNNTLSKDTPENKSKPIGYYEYQLYKTFGRYGTSRGYFDNPTDVAIDSSENIIYILDKGNERIQKFDFEGDYIEHWDYDNLKSDSRKLDDFFKSFHPLILKNSQEVEKITTREKNNIEIIKSDKILNQSIKLYKIPAIALANTDTFKNHPDIYFLQAKYNYTDIAVDLNNKLYIVANKSSHVLKFDIKVYEEKDENNNTISYEYYYEYIDSIGGFGTGEGYFYSPTKIAFDSSKFRSIWVLDSKDGRLHNFELNGDFIKAFMPKDENNKNLKTPSDFCIDNHGFILITDEETHKVYKYNNIGKYIQSFGKEGSKPGEFKNPSAMGIDNEGLIYVVDSSNNRIQVFKPQ